MKVEIPDLPVILTDPRYRRVAALFKALNKKFEPHNGQIEIGRMIFSEGKKRVFGENGRKWGKTTFGIDLCWRLGNLIQNGQGYYFGSYLKNIRETIWANGRLRYHGPQDYIADINKSEMRLTFHSGTFVKCEGADEFNVGRGFNPDFVVCDEFAQFSEQFWAAMSPNLVPKDAICLIIGTPPEQLETEPGKPVIFCRVGDLWKQRMESGDSKYGYTNHSSFVNNHLNQVELKREIQDLIDMGLEDQAQREYYAKRVRFGGQRIIGTFNREEHVKPHKEVMETIQKDINQLTWITACDPGESTVFATLLMAINPYTNEVFFVDEIYEKDENEMMVELLWPRISQKENELYPSGDPERFLRVYDEAAKMFSTEMVNRYGVAFIPTEKALNSVVDGVSLLRTVFHKSKAVVSDRCEWLAWELENWRKTDNGVFERKNDHLIDCARYGLHAGDYVLNPEQREVAQEEHPFYRRGVGLEDDLAEMIEELGRSDPFFNNTDEWNLH